MDFARRLGIDKSSAYDLVQLHRYRAQIESRCLDLAEVAAKRGEPFRYPGWETALSWFYRPSRWRHRTISVHAADGEERTTPPHVFGRFGARCTLDVAASDANHLCAEWITKKQDALKIDWPGTSPG